MRILMLIGGPLLTVAAAHAGVVVHMSSKDLPDGKPSDHQVFYAQNGTLRIDDLDVDGHVERMMLIRDNAVWDVDVARRTYSKLDKGAVAAQASGMTGQMQAALQALPADKRALFEQRLSAMQQKQSTVSDTGRQEQVGRYTCEIWQVARAGKVISESCVASKGSLTGGDELVTSTHNAASVASEVLSGAPMFASAVTPILALYAKIDGFPVRVRQLSGGRADREDAVTSIETQTLPADKFAMPQGFSETPFGARGRNE